MERFLESEDAAEERRRLREEKGLDEAAEDSDGSPVKIFPASELEKLKVILVDTALFLFNLFSTFCKIFIKLKPTKCA